MNRLFCSGGVMCYPVEFNTCRWGGGADHGKTHVFTTSSADLLRFIQTPSWLSWQCVTDDFGTLVPVESKQ